MTRQPGEQRAERYVFEQMAARLVVVSDPPVDVSVLELSVIDEHNPLSLVIYHQSGACTDPEGGCRPRLRTTCRGCRAELVLCMVTFDEMQAIKRGGWRCGTCEVRP